MGLFSGTIPQGITYFVPPVDGTAGDTLVRSSTARSLEFQAIVSAESPVTLVSQAASEVPLTIQAHTSQTDSLLELKDNAGNRIANFGADGDLSVGLDADPVTPATGYFRSSESGTLRLESTGSDPNFSAIGFMKMGSSAQVTVAWVGVISDNAGFTDGLRFATGSNINEASLDDLNFMRMVIDRFGQVGIGPSLFPSAMLDIICNSPARVGLELNAAASQSANLVQIKNSVGTHLAVVDANGNVGIGTASPRATLHGSGSTIIGAASAAVADGDLGNGEINLWIDEGSDELKVKAKYSNGTMKAGTVAALA